MNYKHDPKLTPLAKKLRKEMTPEERHLWYDFLRNYPVRFLRQKVIDHYIADFYCRKAGLVIELDGSQHFEEPGLAKDRIRTEHMEQRGLTVLHIANIDVNQHFESVCAYIDQFVQMSLDENKA